MSEEKHAVPAPPPPPPSSVPPPTQTRTSGNKATSIQQVALKKTETLITREDGQRLIETHDIDGNYKRSLLDMSQYGFIPDLNQDLQVGEVKENLLITSQDVAADIEILEKHKVTHILNLGSYVRNYFPSKIKYRNIKINDVIDQSVLEYFDLAFKFIDEGLKSGCVLIHCNAGVSRASTFMIGYLMNREKMSLDDAFELVKSKRPVIRPNAGFLNQLRMYNKQLGYGESKM